LCLDPLGKESAAEILSALLGDGVEVTALKRVIIAKTGGNPFFIEELVEVLFDEVALVCEGGLVKIIGSPGREPSSAGECQARRQALHQMRSRARVSNASTQLPVVTFS
jgi:hypothetical protein